MNQETTQLPEYLISKDNYHVYHASFPRILYNPALLFIKIHIDQVSLEESEVDQELKLFRGAKQLLDKRLKPGHILLLEDSEGSRQFALSLPEGFRVLFEKTDNILKEVDNIDHPDRKKYNQILDWINEA